MPTERRISKTVTKFHVQITTMDDTLASASTNAGCPAMTVAQCLGVAPADATQWHTLRLAWDGPGGLYGKYANPLTKPSVDGATGDVAVFIRNFQQFAERPLNAIANSPNCSSDLAEVFHVVPVALRSDPVRPTAAISEQCFATIKNLGGGELEFFCRTEHDTKRASKAAHADTIQLAFSVGAEPIGPLPPNDPASAPRPELCRSREVFSKADFILAAGAGNVGQKLYCFTRWYNTRHPELAGPWSAMQTITMGS